jgi:hypothetical protein
MAKELAVTGTSFYRVPIGSPRDSRNAVTTAKERSNKEIVEMRF